MSNNKQSSVEKEFVPYAEALALKQLGFDQPCFAYWNADHSLSKPFRTFVKPFDDEWFIPNPLYSQAFRWFREKYGIFNPQRLIFENLGGKYGLQSHDEHDQVDGYFDTYEEVELACLRRLIEIVNKNNNEQQ